MSQNFFDSLSALRADAPEDSSLLEERLHQLAALGREEASLKMIPRFLNILQILAPLNTGQGRELILRGLDTLWEMAEGRIGGGEAVQALGEISRLARKQLAPLETRGLICSPALWEQLAWDLQRDGEDLRLALGRGDRQRALFLIRLIRESLAFAGMETSAKTAEAAEARIREGDSLGRELTSAVDFFLQESFFLERYRRDETRIVEHIRHLTGFTKKLSGDLLGNPLGLVLSSEEVSALLDEYTEHKAVFTAEAVEPQKIEWLQPAQQPISAENEDMLVKLAGKLFLKQELLKSIVSEDQKILAGKSLESLDELAKKLKEKLFHNYYISVQELLGQELRAFVQGEVDSMGKKVKLGVRGEQSELLAREGAFIKDIVFSLVGNALRQSIETPLRRSAVDKSETAWLLVEFEDTGGEFEIQVRDDGRGQSSEDFWDDLRAKAEGKGGSLTVNSAEGEYLKVSLRIPMKKLLSRSILCRCGEMRFLIPLRSVRSVVAADSIDNPALSKDPRCLGQIALAALMGGELCPNTMALICGFGEELIVYTVEEVLGEVEALVEESPLPLPPCADGAVILRSDQVGFLLNERSLYAKSKELLDKRAETLKVLS